MAIEHLQAAGLPDLANELRRQQDELLEGRRDRDREAGREPFAEFGRELEGLRGQVEGRLHEIERALQEVSQDAQRTLEEVNRSLQRQLEELERSFRENVEDGRREVSRQLDELRRNLEERTREE
jgi:hypothetical protein